MSTIAGVFARSPCLLIMCPRNFNSDFENLRLSGLSVTPADFIRFKTISRCLSSLACFYQILTHRPSDIRSTTDNPDSIEIMQH